MSKVCAFILLLNFSSAFGQRISAFNGLETKVDSTGNYSFWISGHFYGDSDNLSGYPVNTLLGNIEMINHSGASMMICLGDLFKDVRNDIPFYERSLFSQLDIPLYNAVGNHDISGNVYQDHFGATYYFFMINNDVHVILDTELNDGDIKNEQLEMLKAVEEIVKKEQVKNVFVYAHRTIWRDSYEDLANILKDNTQSMLGNNFEGSVLPVIRDISKHCPVWFFGGSLGNAPFSFLHFNPEKNLTYIATAIRGLPRDAMLKVISEKGNVTFETVSLTGEDLMELRDYSVDEWETTSPEQPYNWRLLPLRIKQTILSWSFFFGSLTMLAILLLLKIIRKRRSRTKPLNK